MTKTASEEYALRLLEMKELMKELKNKIATHSKNQKKEPKNWGYVGDMEHYIQCLKDLVIVEEL